MKKHKELKKTAFSEGSGLSPSIKSENKGAARFADQRPEVAIQRKLREDMSESSLNGQSIQLRASMQAGPEKAPIQRASEQNGLPTQLKSGIEGLSGYSMDDVKVHYNSSKPAQLQAHAYAQGSEIHLAPGQEKHLPHEAWHVVQQKQGRVQATRQLKGKVAINDDSGLEREADVMGAKALNQTTAVHQFAKSTVEAEADSGVIQGKFGLEAELDVHLSTAPSPEAAVDNVSHPACVNYPVIAEGDGFEIHIDHSMVLSPDAFKSEKEREDNNKGQNAIIEIITEPPFDEQNSWEETEAQLDKMLAFIDAIENDFSRKDLSTFPHINNVREKNGRTVYVGGKEVEDQSTDAYLHITAGVDLKGIASYFEQLSDMHDANPAPGRRHRKAKPFKDVSQAAALGKEFADNAMTTASDEDKNEITGLVSLLASYMLAGVGKASSQDSALNKNNLGVFFYKSPLVSVRKNLSATNKKRLTTNFKGSIIDFMFDKIKVKRDDTIIYGYTYEKWLTDVLSKGFGNFIHRNTIGLKYPAEDKVLNKSKNPYSATLPMENKEGGKSLFVMENRMVQKFGRDVKYKPNEIKPLIQFYYETLRALNVDE